MDDICAIAVREGHCVCHSAKGSLLLIKHKCNHVNFWSSNELGEDQAAGIKAKQAANCSACTSNAVNVVRRFS